MCIRIVSHPFIQLLIVAVNVIFWMPFGMGYYDWPWDQQAARVGIQVAAFGFLAVAGIGLVAAVGRDVRMVRVFVSALALASSVIGILALYSWMDRYADSAPVQEQQDQTTKAM